MENESQITACDAEVLRYFRRHGPASTADAKKALADVISAGHRIVALAQPDAALLSEDMDTDLSATRALHQGLGIYRITPKGELALDDYLAERKRYWKELLLKSLWFPIAVSFATAVLTTLLTLMLAGLLR
mgnify:CR=1 FL=1